MKAKVYFFMAYLFACIALFITACSENKQTTKPVYKPLIEAVYASGNLLPASEYKVFAQADGYLLRKAVQEGDTVHAGQLLFELESNKQNIRAQNSLEQYRIAKSNTLQESPVLGELEASLASAKAKWQNDSINYIRYKNLLENKATTRIEFDRASLAYQISKNDYFSLKSRYYKTKIQLRAELQNAEAQYKLNTAQNADYTLKSRIHGMVYEIYKEEGEIVRPNEPVALLGDPSKVYLKLSVDEMDVNKVKIGQPVLVKIDTYKNRVFQAKVSKIYPMLNAKEQSFRIDAEFSEEPPRLYAGLTVEANIIIQQKEKALTIPKTYLLGEDSVQIEQNGETKMVKIRKGAENLEYVEVLAGLDTNSVLVMQ